MEHESVISSALRAVKEWDLNELKSIASSIPKDKVSEILSGPDVNGDTPLIEAIGRSTSIVRFLLEECHVDPMISTRRFFYPLNPLNKAVSRGELDVVKLLVDSGAKLNIFNTDKDFQFSPLYVACQHRHEKIARFLIEKGEDINKSHCLLVSFFSCEFLKYILDRGADVDIKGSGGETPLHVCCRWGYFEYLKILVEENPDHNAVYEGLTPLQMAALNSHEDIVYLYVDKNYCNPKETSDCIDLLGVGSLIKGDLPSAVRYWNKALKEMPQSIEIVFESSILRTLYKKNSESMNYDELIDDRENAAIHALMILERVIGIESLKSNDSILQVALLIGMNIEFWDAILDWTLNQHLYNYFHEFNQHFTLKFEEYVLSSNLENINSSALELFYKFINASLKPEILESESWEYDNFFYDSIRIIVIVCLNSLKENIVDFDMEWFHIIIKIFRKSLTFSDVSIFHILIEEGLAWGYPERTIYETFELCCKLCDPVNDLDEYNETPLQFALREFKENEFIDILLECGAVIDTKNEDGISIRECATEYGRQDICIGCPSLEIQINAKLYKNHLRCCKELSSKVPDILKNFMEFH